MEEAAGCTDEDALDCATEDAASEDCAPVTELDDRDAALLVAADDAVTDDDAFCDAVLADEGIVDAAPFALLTAAEDAVA